MQRPTYRWTDKQKDAETNGQTDRLKNRKMQRPMDRWTDRQGR